MNNPDFTRKLFWITIAFSFLSVALQGQPLQPVLEKTISVTFENEEPAAALNKIAALASCSFSYNPNVISDQKSVSGSFSNKPVREVLHDLFNNTVDCRERKGYIILKRAATPKQPDAVPEDYIFSGYIRDDEGQPVPWVSVYDKISLESTVSNDYGYYRIKLAEKQLPLDLTFSKQHFNDTVVRLDNRSKQFINITLNKIRVPLMPDVDYDSVSLAAERTARTLFDRFDENENAVNIKDTLYRKSQVSFLPYMGTNLGLSGNVINKYSFNVFGGLSMGTTQLELGGFFNIDKHDVRYVQMAGFTNLVGGSVEGVQLAGFTNLVAGNFNGLQASGFVNVNWSDFEGVQLAGFVNTTRKNFNGLQGAGFVNVNWHNFEGVQLGGFVNTVRGSLNGVQMAGFINTTLDTSRGFQLAGFCNSVVRSFNGVQLSGVVNAVTDTLYGVQLSTVNYARVANGSQVGFLNLSDTTNGIPVGFLSFVNKGYHKLELSANEIFPVNLAFRTGVKSFHNILVAGYNPSSGDTSSWSYGYGVGTSTNITKKTLLDVDLTSSQFMKGNKAGKINMLNKLYLGFDTRLGNKITVAYGLSLNMRISDTNYTGYPDIYTYYTPNIFYSHTWEPDHTKMELWLGANVGLRFF